MEHNETLVREANRLYWQTERSIADIAEQLSVSRRALYELVTPEPAGSSCTQCGGDVVFANRSAKAAGAGRCAECDAEYVAATETELTEATAPPVSSGWPRAVRAAASSADDLPARALKIGGVAAVGVALGALAALLIVRRR